MTLRVPRILRTARQTALGIVTLALLAGIAGAAGLVVALPPGLAPDVAAPLRQIAERATVVGHVEGPPFRLPGGVFEYLLDHPEFAAYVAQALKIGNYRVWREPDGLWLDDGRGAVGRFAVVYAAGGSRVIHVRGRYKHRYVPAIHGEALALLEYTSRAAGDEKTVIAPTLTGFVRLDSVVAETLSRLMSETAKTKAERMARRVVTDFEQAASRIDADPRAVIHELRRRPGVPARELGEFSRLLSLPRPGAS